MEIKIKRSTTADAQNLTRNCEEVPVTVTNYIHLVCFGKFWKMEDETDFNEGNEEESEMEECLDPGNPEDYFAIIESEFNKVSKEIFYS